MRIAFFLTLVLFPIFWPSAIFGIYDPDSVPNNKYGIHIIDQNDLVNAANLVNSSGGDWGYVTLVITQNDLDFDKWQNIFNKMRELHLIPLLRLATESKGNIWLAPDFSKVKEYARFLDSLTWVVKNRYVIIFNEPNHAKEWGGIIDPGSYTQILASYSATLKSLSDDFYILPAGFDAAAGNTQSTMDEELFIKKMSESDPQIFQYIDGWSSHAYPQPQGNHYKYSNGRESLQTYKWELNLLNKLGVSKNFPVFITESGWPHLEGIPNTPGLLTSESVSNLVKDTTEDLLTDTQIAAFTPFILNYQSYPFSNFSWQKPNSADFYPHYFTYQALTKIKGEPKIEIIISPSVNPSETSDNTNIKGTSIERNNTRINGLINKIIDNSKELFSLIIKIIS